MEPLIRLSGSSGLAEIDLDTYRCIKARAETGQSLSKSDWLLDSTKDWFCGTQLCEAKKRLYSVVAAEASDHERLQNFRLLKEAVSPAYRERFVEIETPNGFAIGLMANISDKDVFSFSSLYEFNNPSTVCSLEHIQKQVNEEVQAALDGVKAQKQMAGFVRDAAEAVLIIEGEAHAPVGRVQDSIGTAWALVQLLVDKLCCTEEQLTTIFALAQQRMFGVVAEASLEENGGLLTRGEVYYHIGPSNRLEFRFRRIGDHVEMTGYSSLFPMSREMRKTGGEVPTRRYLAPDPVESFVLSIAPNGRATIISALFGKETS